MTETNRSRPGALIGVAFSGVFLGAILGAITNSVNGWVSPLYFHNIMRWDGVQDSHDDLDAALNEMLFSGGSLNLKLLGAHEPEQKSAGCN